MATRARLSEEDVAYLKIMRVLVNVCAAELRRVFKDVWDSQSQQKPWMDNDKSGKIFYDKYKPDKKDLSKRYDDTVKTGRRSEWDMTVLCRVFIEYKFMVSIDQKYRHNVSTLRKLRNTYAHITSTSRSQAQFQGDIQDIRTVFQNLSLDETLLNVALDIEVSDVDNQTLCEEMERLKAQLVTEVQQYRQEMHERFDGVHDLLETLKLSTGEEIISGQVKKELSATSKLFVKTAVYSSVASALDREHVVFITGPSGVGKRMIALELLREYNKNQGFDPLILRHTDELRNMIKPETKQAIFVRNIFGIFEFDQNKFDELLGYFDTLIACADETKRFIFTSKASIFERGRAWLSISSAFRKQQVIDRLQLYNLSYDEKAKILQRHLEEVDVDLPESLIERIAQCDTPYIFPKCCQLFARTPELHNHSSAVEFFQKPVLYHKSIVEGMAQRNDKTPFAVLLLTLIFGQLSDVYLSGTDHPDEQNVYRILSVLGCGEKTRALRSSAESLLGTLLKKSGESFVFLDQSVYDAVAYVFMSRYPALVLNLCSVEFLCNCVLGIDNKQTDTDLHIALGENQFRLLSDRFVRELKIGNFYTVSSHAAFTEVTFVRYFFSYVERLEDLRSLTMPKDKDHQPFLYWSSWNPKGHLFKQILREYEKQDEDVSDEEMRKIAKACCISGNVEVLEIIFQNKSNITAMIRNVDATPLIMPPYGSTQNKARGITRDVVQVGGLLHTACFHGNLSVVEFLVKQFHSSVDIPDKYGLSPINIAARQGHLQIVEYLIASGVKVSWKRTGKNTVLHDACETGETDMVRFLLKEYPRLLHVVGEEPHLRYPIHVGAMSKERNLIHILMEKGANPESLDYGRNTAFHSACSVSGNREMLAELDPSPKQINTVNKRSKTCLHLACEFGGADMVDFLIGIGAEINAVDYMGRTPLHIACQRNKVVIVERLMHQKDVDLFALDFQQKSALHLTTSTNIAQLIKHRMNKCTSGGTD